MIVNDVPLTLAVGVLGTADLTAHAAGHLSQVLPRRRSDGELSIYTPVGLCGSARGLAGLFRVS